jgi:hypothetical protein
MDGRIEERRFIVNRKGMTEVYGEGAEGVRGWAFSLSISV